MGNHIASRKETGSAVGLYTRYEMKQHILPYLVIGNRYTIKSVHKYIENNKDSYKCKLVELSMHCAVFEYSDNTKEAFTYVVLWIQKMSGTFKAFH